MSVLPFELIDAKGKSHGHYLTTANAIAIAWHYKLAEGWTVKNVYEEAGK